MTAPVFDTKLAVESEAFPANAAHNRPLRDELHAKVAQAALGGSEAARAKHVARGKLLPRDGWSGCSIRAVLSLKSAS